MLISYRGEIGEPVACQVEMAVHTKALLDQLCIPDLPFPQGRGCRRIAGDPNHAYMARKPVAVLMDASFEGILRP